MRNLLIVDDERIIRVGISKCLNWHNLGISEVFTASNGIEALEIIKTQNIDIVVADIVMPELTGIELIEKCRSENIAAEFVILSSFDDFKYAQKAIKNGVCEYLLKPCNPEELKNVILKLQNKLDLTDIQNAKSTKMNKRMEALLPHAKAQVLHELFLTPTVNKKRLEELCSFLQLKSGDYCLLLLPLNFNPNIIIDQKNVITSMSKKFEDYIFCFEKNQFYVFTDNTSKESITDIAKKLQSCAFELELEDSYVIVSRMIDIQGISRSHQKAMEISHLMYYFEPNEIIYSNSINLYEYLQDNLVMEKLIHDMSEAILITDTSESLSQLEKIFTLFKSNYYSFKSVQEICLRIYLSIINGSKADDKYYVEKLSLINQAVSVQAIYDILVQEISHIVISNSENLYDTYSKTVRTAIDYINENLADCTLSLNKIASSVLYMNVDYFGKLFRKECGIKFSNYLLALRMNKAKQLLNSTETSITNVAEQVGFEDSPNYFSHLFKKYTGVLPKDYKNSLQKK